MPLFKETSLIRKAIYSCILLAIITFVGIFGLYYSVAWGIVCDMPSKNDLASIKNYQASDILAKNGELLGRFFCRKQKQRGIR